MFHGLLCAADFSLLLRAYLDLSGMTQKQFSDALGCPLRTFEDWLSKKRCPPDYIAVAILDRACDIAYNYF